MTLNMVTDNSKNKKFPCDSCHTDCCKEYVIFVNAHDIYRLSMRLKLNPMNFLEILGAKDYDLGINVEEGLIDLILKQKNDGCMFLEETKDTFRCTVNDFKPSICKSYPFQIKNEKLIQMSDIMCPVDWNIKEFESIMLPHLKKDYHEWKFYDNLILEWNTKNSTKKPLSAFLKFILNRVSLEFVQYP